jgi:hypothetical protein
MTPSTRARRVAAVLVVVFLLTTVWAVYYLYSDVHPANGGPRAPTLASYSQATSSSFVANLRPSYLYNNSTEIEGGNVTLFTPITNWINVTTTYSLAANRSLDLDVSAAMSVTLSTPVWSKQVATVDNSTSATGATGAFLTLTYAVNVAAIVALANAINDQVDYQGAVFTLSLAPGITGTASVLGSEDTFSFSPTFNLTFSGSLVQPSGLSYAGGGDVLGPTPTTAASGPLAAAAPYLALVGAVSGLGGSAWVASRRPDEEPLLPLDALVRPYEEAVALTTEPPEEFEVTPVATLPDLAKIADTLGKPILRPTGPDPFRRTFYVVDGRIAYSYVYPGSPVRPAGDLASIAGASPVVSAAMAALVRRLQDQISRVRSLSLDPETAQELRHRVQHAIDLIRDGESAKAGREVDRIAELITRAGAAQGR